MAESNIHIQLDTVRKNNIRLIYAVQNDYGARYLTVEMMTDGKSERISSQAVVSINAKRSDGKKSAFSGVVNADGTVTVPVTNWMLEVEGEVTCSVSVVESGKRLTTTHFYMQAQESIWDGTSEPSADDPNRDVILEISISENARILSENERISAENDRKSAELARADAESVRIENEGIRVDNEAERESAESVRRAEFETWQGEIGKISAFDKRIENLESAVSPGLVTPMVDDSAAYVKNVPMGALPNALITEIGGMTRKCANLISFPYVDASKTSFLGLTIAHNDDQSITINGTATDSGQYIFALLNGVVLSGSYYCTINGGVLPAGCSIYSVTDGTTLNWLESGKTSQVVAADNFKVNAVSLWIKSGAVFNNRRIYPFLAKSETALPYEPYFKGLRDAKVTAVESVGANLISFPYVDANKTSFLGLTITHNDDQSITINGTATDGGQYVFTQLNGAVLRGSYYCTINGGVLPVGCSIYSVTDGTTLNWLESGKASQVVSVESSKVNAVNLWIKSGSVFNNMRIYPFLAKSETAILYAPYFKRIFRIPAAVQALEGYGQGVNEQYHNKIALDPAECVKKFVKMTERVVFDGTESWTAYRPEDWTESFCKFEVGTGFGSGVFGDYEDLVSNYLTHSLTITTAGTYSPNTLMPHANGNLYVAVEINGVNSVDTWKAYLQNNPLVVQLRRVTPIETDISDYFGDDNFIGVEGGGAITAVNEYGYDVPSEIEYAVKGSDVT